MVDRVANEFKSLRDGVSDVDRRLAILDGRTATLATAVTAGVNPEALAAFFADSGTINFVYSPGTGTITADIQDNSVGVDELSTTYATSSQVDTLADTRASARIDSGGFIRSRSRFNFISGEGIDLALADDPTNNEVDVTIHTGATITVPFHIGTPLVLTDQTSAVAHFGGGTIERVTLVTLTRCTQARLVALVTTLSASANTPRVRLRYRAAGYSATVGDYSQIGTSEVQVSLAATGLIDSGWIAMTGAALVAGTAVTVDQIGGDGAADPAVTSVIAYFR
jgi:hypothetical protein